jgi:hypothetical protein
MAAKLLRLSVADSNNQKVFLSMVQKEARRVWRHAHPTQLQKGGRPSLAGAVRAICSELWPTYTTRKPTLGELIHKVNERLPAKPRAGQRYSDTTLRHHIMHWMKDSLSALDFPTGVIMKNPRVREVHAFVISQHMTTVVNDYLDTYRQAGHSERETLTLMQKFIAQLPMFYERLATKLRVIQQRSSPLS